MKKLPEITNIVFHKVGKPKDSFLGYVSFMVDGQFAFNECGLHRRNIGKPSFRVVYPENRFRLPVACPITKEMQEHIDTEISSYLQAQRGMK